MENPAHFEYSKSPSRLTFGKLCLISLNRDHVSGNGPTFSSNEGQVFMAFIPRHEGLKGILVYSPIDKNYIFHKHIAKVAARVEIIYLSDLNEAVHQRNGRGTILADMSNPVLRPQSYRLYNLFCQPRGVRSLWLCHLPAEENDEDTGPECKYSRIRPVSALEPDTTTSQGIGHTSNLHQVGACVGHPYPFLCLPLKQPRSVTGQGPIVYPFPHRSQYTGRRGHANRTYWVYSSLIFPCSIWNSII